MAASEGARQNSKLNLFDEKERAGKIYRKCRRRVVLEKYGERVRRQGFHMCFALVCYGVFFYAMIWYKIYV